MITINYWYEVGEILHECVYENFLFPDIFKNKCCTKVLEVMKYFKFFGPGV